MKNTDRQRRILCIVVVAVLMLSSIGLMIWGNSYVQAAQSIVLTSGQQNIVKRAYQMTNIQWTPVGDIAGWGNGLTYKAGTTYTGLPYGQPVYASYVPWSTSLEGFLQAVNAADSKMYTSYSSYNKRAPYYSVDCSAFVSWAWGLSSRQTTSTIKNFATQISTSSYANAQVGDCLCLAGSHVVLITDITYDSSGAINGIEISESTVNAATNYCCQKTRYGAGGSKTLTNLTTKYFGSGYILYRSKTRDSVTYTHSCAVPLEGDICAACGMGGFAETPVNLTVIATENISLYASPSSCAEQIGTIYAGNKIAVTASCEDSDGKLWYKTADGEWILAEKTKPICQHSYSYSVTEPPSCIVPGCGTYICILCGDSYTQAIAETGHRYVSTVIPPGCEKTGYTEYICMECSDRYRDSETPATGHSYVNGACSDCGAIDIVVLMGDLNGDGALSSADSVLMARYLTDLQQLNGNQLLLADLNQDGAVTSADSVLLVKLLIQ